ncbi:hypothetical protein NMY22_g14749 [Coprinellus aureogranulatus]|nr:hypothetical protein NMY22_g14749 [Coprinellus aureogranulatus]
MVTLPDALLAPPLLNRPQAYIVIMPRDDAQALKASMTAQGRIKTLPIDDSEDLVVFSGQVAHWNAISKVARVALVPKRRRLSLVADGDSLALLAEPLLCLFIIAMAIGGLFTWTFLAFGTVHPSGTLNGSNLMNSFADCFYGTTSFAFSACRLIQRIVCQAGRKIHQVFQGFLGWMIFCLEQMRGELPTLPVGSTVGANNASLRRHKIKSQWHLMPNNGVGDSHSCVIHYLYSYYYVGTDLGL